MPDSVAEQPQIMKLAIREARLEGGDRPELIRFLYENLTKNSDDARFEWLYLGNPGGPARAWIASDTDSNQTVGVAAAFPRHFWVDGASRRVWVLGDFCISSQCRSLGPALRLQRECLASMSAECWYDFPSRTMNAVYKRIGLYASIDAVRFAKLLRVDSKIEGLIPAQPIARTLSRAGNTLLRLRSRGPRPRDIQVTVFEGRFGEEFNELNTQAMTGYRTQGQRTAAFLNWRYRDDPLTEQLVVVARRRSQLLGFAAAVVSGIEATLTDIRAINEEETVPAMLTGMEELLSNLNVQTLNAPLLAGPGLQQLLHSEGFHRRETSPVVFHNNGSDWLLLASDRDS